jgi:hypothetical protein
MLPIARHADVVGVDVITCADLRMKDLVIVQAAELVAEATDGARHYSAHHHRANAGHQALIFAKPLQKLAAREKTCVLTGARGGR